MRNYNNDAKGDVGGGTEYESRLIQPGANCLESAISLKETFKQIMVDNEKKYQKPPGRQV